LSFELEAKTVDMFVHVMYTSFKRIDSIKRSRKVSYTVIVIIKLVRNFVIESRGN